MARICVVRQDTADSTRVAREVDALVGERHRVDYICLGEAGQPFRFSSRGLVIWRLPPVRPRPAGTFDYLMSYSSFFVMAAVLVTLLHLRHRFSVVQVNTLPDALVFVTTVPRLLGARVLLDLQESMPEFYATKFATSMRHPVVRLIGRIEQAAIRFSHAVITPTPQLKQTFVGRGADPAKIAVVFDGSDESVFRPRADVQPDPSTFTLICHGTVEERYGLDTVIRAVGMLRDEMPELRLRVVGDGAEVPRLRQLALELDIGDSVSFTDGFIPLEDLVEAIASSDVGVVAMKRDAFRDVTLTCKMFDYLAMHRPLLISRTRSVEETLSPDSACFFESDDPEDLARGITALHASAELRRDMASRAHRHTEPYRWCHQRRLYLAAVGQLLDVPTAP